MSRWSSLHRDDELILAAMRTRRSVRSWRVADIAKIAGLPYGRAWRACGRLQLWGYVERDSLRRCWPRWDRLALNHRLAVVEAEDEIEAEVEPEPRWVRILRSVLAHLGGTWV